jgi:hypothetical protein
MNGDQFFITGIFIHQQETIIVYKSDGLAVSRVCGKNPHKQHQEDDCAENAKMPSFLGIRTVQ